MAGEQILIVDDNRTNLKLMRVLLETEGYNVRTATEAGEVFQTLQSAAPRLILMDIQLPGIDGLTVTRALKAEPDTKEIPVVGISAHALQEDMQRALEAGCVAYLPKPLDTRRFRDLVVSLLSGDPEQNATDR